MSSGLSLESITSAAISRHASIVSAYGEPTGGGLEPGDSGSGTVLTSASSAAGYSGYILALFLGFKPPYASAGAAAFGGSVVTIARDFAGAVVTASDSSTGPN